MQVPAGLNVLVLDHHVAVTSARGGRDNVFVEGKRDEYNERDEIYHCTDGAHCFRAEQVLALDIHAAEG